MLSTVTPALVSPVGVEYRSLNEQVYSVLLAAIAERRIGAGQRLILDDLSAQLKVSRTPVRDALSRLAAEGLVQPHGRRGYCVTFPTPTELMHLFDLRLMCELYAVEKGLGNLVPDLVDRLEKLAEEAASLSAFTDPAHKLSQRLKDRQFHLLIVGLAENAKLTELYERLNIHIHTARLDLNPIGSSELRIVNRAEHFAITTALRSADLHETREAIRMHIVSAGARTMAALELDERTSSR